MIEIFAIVSAAVASISVGYFTFRFFFDDSEDFWECIRFSFTPDIFSLFRGEYFRDIGKSTKLSLYLLLIGLAAYFTYSGISNIGS